MCNIHYFLLTVLASPGLQCGIGVIVTLSCASEWMHVCIQIRAPVHLCVFHFRGKKLRIIAI